MVAFATALPELRLATVSLDPLSLSLSLPDETLAAALAPLPFASKDIAAVIAAAETLRVVCFELEAQASLLPPALLSSLSLPPSYAEEEEEEGKKSRSFLFVDVGGRRRRWEQERERERDLLP